MPPFPQRARLHFTLAHDVEREILMREVDSAIARMQRSVEAAYPEGLPQMKKPGSKAERLFNYELLTMPVDVDIILQDNYIELFKKQEAPMPESEFWKQLIMFEVDFTKMLKDYKTLRAEFA